MTTVQIQSACSSAGKTQDQLLKKMAWIHAFANNAPVSYPQDHPEDALSSAGHGNVSVSQMPVR